MPNIIHQKIKLNNCTGKFLHLLFYIINMKVLDCAKLPYKICRGSVKDRKKLAECMLQKFVNSVEKEFQNSGTIDFRSIYDKIDDVIPVNNIFFNVKRERSGNNYFDVVFDWYRQVKSYKIVLETDNLSKFSKNNKNILYHEVWHFFDAITNPKYASRSDFCYSKQYDKYLELYDDFFYTKESLSRKFLRNRLKEMLNLINDDEKVDMLQLLRYSLIRENSAYEMADTFAPDYGEYKKYKFPRKIRIVSDVLLKVIKEQRKKRI